MGLEIWALGARVWGLGVQGSRFRVYVPGEGTGVRADRLLTNITAAPAMKAAKAKTLKDPEPLRTLNPKKPKPRALDTQC